VRIFEEINRLDNGGGGVKRKRRRRRGGGEAGRKAK